MVAGATTTASAGEASHSEEVGIFRLPVGLALFWSRDDRLTKKSHEEEVIRHLVRARMPGPDDLAVSMEMIVPLVGVARIKAFNYRRASSAPTRCRLDAIRDRSKVPVLAPRPQGLPLVPRPQARALRPQGRRTDTSPTRASLAASTPSSQRTRCCRPRYELTCFPGVRRLPSRCRPAPGMQTPTFPPM
jgi:hypothetical protein